MKYEMINLEDYFQTGEGGTALTYNHKDQKTLAKLFMPGMAADTAEREFLINQVVYDSGLPTPKPIRLITDGTRFGAEYELIPNKRSLYPYIATKLAYIIGKLGYGAKGVSDRVMRMFGLFLGIG